MNLFKTIAPAALLTLSACLAIAQSSAPSTVFGYPDFAAEAKTEQTSLPSPTPNSPAKNSRPSPPSPTSPPRPKTTRPPNTSPKNSTPPASKPKSSPTRAAQHAQSRQSRGLRRRRQAPHDRPHPEHVDGDPFQNDPRVIMPPSTAPPAPATSPAKSSTPTTAASRISTSSPPTTSTSTAKSSSCRYGANFRGVKVYIAQQRGAAGVLIYSDPADDGYYRGDVYPDGPWRPATGVQRGSVQYLFKYPGDPETPGVASTPDLPDSARVDPRRQPAPHHLHPPQLHDAAPILKALKGPGVPQSWQGALPFHYHVGPGGVTRPPRLPTGLPAPHHLGCHRHRPRHQPSR